MASSERNKPDACEECERLRVQIRKLELEVEFLRRLLPPHVLEAFERVTPDPSGSSE